MGRGAALLPLRELNQIARRRFHMRLVKLPKSPGSAILRLTRELKRMRIELYPTSGSKCYLPAS
jgi:hypothetical protein